jgi:uncharacterized protein (UPF0147 family)
MVCGTDSIYAERLTTILVGREKKLSDAALLSDKIADDTTLNRNVRLAATNAFQLKISNNPFNINQDLTQLAGQKFEK